MRALLDRDTAPGAEPEDLLRLDIPALVVPGQDASHATSVARYLHECLPRSEYLLGHRAGRPDRGERAGPPHRLPHRRLARRRHCMIIDIHWHYTTEPAALHTFRDKQLAGLADPARRPAAKTLADLNISDDTIVQSLQPQLKLQKERGSDLTIFSPRAAGMAHHVGNAEVSRNGPPSATT